MERCSAEELQWVPIPNSYETYLTPNTIRATMALVKLVILQKGISGVVRHFQNRHWSRNFNRTMLLWSTSIVMCSRMSCHREVNSLRPVKWSHSNFIRHSILMSLIFLEAILRRLAKSRRYSRKYWNLKLPKSHYRKRTKTLNQVY